MMMNRRVALPALLLAAAAGLAGCANAPGTISPTPTPTTPAAPTCPQGGWKTTGVAATTAVGTVPVNMQGGADVKATIGADGAVSADFTGMKPVVYSATIAGAQVTGEFTYTGTASGKVDLTATGAATSSSSTGTATPTGSAAPGNPWRLSGTVDWSQVKLTAKLTQPAALTVIDNVKLTDVTGAQTTQVGNVIDLQPLLRNGSYRCDGSAGLVITPTASGGPTVAWTFARVTS
jgi:hypothetical protein